MKIKKGKIFNVRVKVVDIDDDTGEITTDTVNENGYSLGFEWCYYAPGEALAFSPITTENGIKNTEPTPKYDPCRLLKKGDRVQVKKRNGRCNGKDGEYLREAFCEVAEDEEPNELVRVYHNSSEYRLDPAYLELITPVEEMELYSVRHNEVHAAWSIYGPYGLSSVNYFYGERYPYTKETAKEAAESECKRLNEEYRKEQK